MNQFAVALSRTDLTVRGFDEAASPCGWSMVSGRGRPKAAVVGSGVSGLTAAYLLQARYDVTLYEADTRIGGHVNTHHMAVDGETVDVDSGFIVHNAKTYPLLLRLFNELGVKTRPAEMSMSVSCDGCGLVYAGARGLGGLFADPANIHRPAYLHMLLQVPRFYRQARTLLASDDPVPEPTLREFLIARKYSPYFVRHFVVPLVSAVWSCGTQAVLEYPARYLFVFLAHHGLLELARNTSWRTVVGGSERYVEKILPRLAQVRTATPVRSVSRTGDGVLVRDAADSTAAYAAIVIATHADQALKLLSDPSEDEARTLGAFSYSYNEALLHSDDSVLPRMRGASASWNYWLPACEPDSGRAQVSYDMNRLQGLASSTRFVVTLNGEQRVNPGLTHAKITYKHPVYNHKVCAAQSHLADLNRGATAFAGAYHGWGFHEDGCRSAVAAARALGVRW